MVDRADTLLPDDEYLDWEAGALERSTHRLGPEQREAVRRHLQHCLPTSTLDYFSSDPNREQAITSAIRAAFEKQLVRATRRHPLPHVITPEFVRDVYDDVVGLGPLEPLLRDPAVTSVSVLDWQTILVERGKARARHAETFRDQSHLEAVADNLAVMSGYALSLKVRPRMTHFSVNPPARIHIDVSAVGGPFIGFRRGRATPWPLAEFVRLGSLNSAVAGLLQRLARAEVPMLIAGPPGAGKTTLLEALIHELPERHLVTIEDGAYELHPDHPFVTHIVVPPRGDDEAGHTAGDMAEAAKSALRKNADQVVYGEIMDGNAGHVIANAPSFRFSATTLHGHTIEAALARFSILAQLDNTTPRSPYVGLDNALVRADIALGFRVVILCGRLADDRQVVREVAWLDGVDASARNAEFRLRRLVTLQERVTATGVEPHWQVAGDFVLPPPYAVNLQAADLAAARRLGGELVERDAYQQALAAVQASDWERAATYLLQVLQAGRDGASAALPAPASADAAGLLRKVLQRAGTWPALLGEGQRAAAALQALLKGRSWTGLERALAIIDANAPLALAAGAAVDLCAIRAELGRGRERDARAAAQLDSARRLAEAGRCVEALDLLLATAGADGLEAEHYRALARAARALFGLTAGALPHAQRCALATRLDALVHLAGEAPIEHGEVESTLNVILAEAAHTADLIEAMRESGGPDREPQPRRANGSGSVPAG